LVTDLVSLVIDSFIIMIFIISTTITFKGEEVFYKLLSYYIIVLNKKCIQAKIKRSSDEGCIIKCLKKNAQKYIFNNQFIY